MIFRIQFHFPHDYISDTILYITVFVLLTILKLLFINFFFKISHLKIEFLIVLLHVQPSGSYMYQIPIYNSSQKKWLKFQNIFPRRTLNV